MRIAATVLCITHAGHWRASWTETLMRGLEGVGLASAYRPAVCNGGPDKAEPAVRYRVLRRVR